MRLEGRSADRIRWSNLARRNNRWRRRERLLSDRIRKIERSISVKSGRPMMVLFGVVLSRRTENDLTDFFQTHRELIVQTNDDRLFLQTRAFISLKREETQKRYGVKTRDHCLRLS